MAVSSSFKKDLEAASLKNGNKGEEPYSENFQFKSSSETFHSKTSSENVHHSSKNVQIIFHTSSLKNTKTPQGTKNRNFMTPSSV